MKRITGVIAGLLAVSMLLCGCNAESLLSQFGPKETLYLLKECVQLDEDGQVLSRCTYEYDDRGLVTAYETDNPSYIDAWNDDLKVFEYIPAPCDGVVDFSIYCSYDKKGNPTRVADSRVREVQYEYSYGSKGQILSFTQQAVATELTIIPLVYNLEYDADGTGTLWYNSTSGEERVSRTWQTDGKNMDRIHELQLNTLEGVYTYSFEYDKDGNMTGFQSVVGSARPLSSASCSYDGKGRVISEQGLRKSTGEQITYQYEDDMLVAINGEELTVTENSNGKMTVRYKDCELTYESIRLTEAEVNLARYRWNQFCAGFRTEHSYSKGIEGYHYPVFDLNTVLLLPQMIYG